MLVKLIRIRLRALFYMIFGRRLGGKKLTPIKKVLIGLFAAYMVGALFFSMGSMLYVIAGPLINAGLDWLYFAVAGLFAAVLSIIGSVFTVQKELFDATDNDLLLSMPIPYSYILASRLSLIVVLELLYTIMMMLPAGIVYAFFGTITAQGVFTLIAASFLLTLLTLAVGTLFGWLAGLVTSRFRSKTLVTTLLMFGFIGLYIWLYSNMGSYIMQLSAQGASIAESMQKALPPIYNFGMAITAGGFEGLVHLGIFTLWCLVPFAIMYFILARSFLRLATSSKPTVKKEYKKRSLRVSGGFYALVKKELRRFFTLPVYLLNTGMGAVFLLVMAVVLVVKRDDLYSLLSAAPEMKELLAPILCMAICFCALMTDTAAPSLSLEGKSLWILKALPINPKDIFGAKIAVNLIIGLPGVIIAALVSWFVIPLEPGEAVMVLITPSVFMCFIAVYGMAMNILFPRFEWINETLVIKQSGSVMAAVLGGMAIAAVPTALFIPAVSVMAPVVYLIICAAVFAAATVAIYAWINTRGVKRFEAM